MSLHRCKQAFVKAPPVTVLLVSALAIPTIQAQGAPGVELEWWHAQGVLNAYGEGASAESAADAAIAYKGWGYVAGAHRSGGCTFYLDGGTGNSRWTTYLCPVADKNGFPLVGVLATSRVVLYPGIPCTSNNPTENCQYHPVAHQVISDKNLGHPTDYCPVGNPINQLTRTTSPSASSTTKRACSSATTIRIQMMVDPFPPTAGTTFGSAPCRSV